MNKITTIEELKGVILKAQKKEYLEVMKLIDIPISAFNEYATWDAGSITRNCISKSSNYELLLVCWDEGQSTPIHDYNFQQAWIHPVSGVLKEERFIFDVFTSALVKVSSITLERGDFSFMNNVGGIHRYFNASGKKAMSLHLYSNPVKEWRVYDADSGDSFLKQVNYN